MADPTLTQLDDRELENQTVDTANFPYQKQRAMLYWNGSAWTKWDKTVTATLASSQTIGLVPAISGGLTTFHLVSAASTNATNVKNSAGQLYGWYIYNSNASARKIAFHNTSGTPTAGSSIFFTLVLPGGSAANVFNDVGIPFSSGIGISTVTGLADSDATGVAANDLIVNLFYK